MEKELLARVAAGDEAAFRQLVRQFSGLLYNFLYSHLKNNEAAEEIMQDILVQVWQTREGLIEIRNFRTYLFVLCRNYAINEINRLIRMRTNLQRYKAAGLLEAYTEQVPDADERLTLLQEAIDELPRQQRLAWILSRREGRSYKEIATQMQISAETVKKHIQAATASIIGYVQRKSPLLATLLLLSTWKK